MKRFSCFPLAAPANNPIKLKSELCQVAIFGGVGNFKVSATKSPQGGVRVGVAVDTERVQEIQH